MTPLYSIHSPRWRKFLGGRAGRTAALVLLAISALGGLEAQVGSAAISVSRNPVTATVGTAIPAIDFGLSGGSIQAGSFRVTGPLPNGVTVNSSTAGIVNGSSGRISGLPTAAGSYAVSIVAYAGTNGTGEALTPESFLVGVNVNPIATVAPAFVSQPVSQTVSIGGTATFAVAINDTPAIYQWRRDNREIVGATRSTLSLGNIQFADGGSYSVQVSNSAGVITSGVASLIVPFTPAPAFTKSPESQTITSGTTVAFSSVAPDATSFQWRRNDSPIPGATSSLYVIFNATAADAGAYSVVASNVSGSTTSTAARLGISPSGEVSRLTNLSILTTTGPGTKVLTMGAAIGGTSAPGDLPLLVRGVGPGLIQFNQTGVLPDPVLTVNIPGSDVPIAVNDNWGSSLGLSEAFDAVAAFQLPVGSLDSAISSRFSSRNYSFSVTGKNGATGLALAEIYDASGSTRTAGSPRLTNLSTSTSIDPGATLAVGFTLGGTTPRTVIVRAVGPTLATTFKDFFSPGSTMRDPKLDLFALFDGGPEVKIAENNDWGGLPPVISAMAAVAAFPLDGPLTKDAVVVTTLPPGRYSARVTGADGGGGQAIVEVYEVP